MTLGHTNLRNPSELIDTTYYTDYATNHKQKLKNLYHKIADKLTETKQKVIDKRNVLGSEQFQFAVGQIVFKSNPSRNKKDNKFKGPYELIEILENNKVKIQNRQTNKIDIVHIKELKIPTFTELQPVPD